MRNTVSAFLLFCFMHTSHAQLVHSSWQVEGSIIHDKYEQFQRLLRGSFRDGRDNFIQPEGTYDNVFFRRFQSGIAVKKFNDKGNYLKLRFYGGRQEWQREIPFGIADTTLNLVSVAPFSIGLAEQETYGLDFTKGFVINPENDVVQFFIGSRVNTLTSLGRYDTFEEGFNEEKRNFFLAETAILPELSYFFPGNKLSFSLGIHLPFLSFEHEHHFSTQTPEDVRPFNDRTNSIEFLAWQRHRVEFGFGWFL